MCKSKPPNCQWGNIWDFFFLFFISSRKKSTRPLSVGQRCSEPPYIQSQNPSCYTKQTLAEWMKATCCIAVNHGCLPNPAAFHVKVTVTHTCILFWEKLINNNANPQENTKCNGGRVSAQCFQRNWSHNRGVGSTPKILQSTSTWLIH